MTAASFVLPLTFSTGVQISSTSPVAALISVRSPVTSFAVLHLNGSVDWIVAQRTALLAWTGHALNIKPTLNKKLVRMVFVDP